jgi:hypothetical protein
MMVYVKNQRPPGSITNLNKPKCRDRRDLAETCGVGFAVPATLGAIDLNSNLIRLPQLLVFDGMSVRIIPLQNVSYVLGTFCKRCLRTVQLEEWSGRMDLNHRPPGPEPGALARLRYAPTNIECTRRITRTPGKNKNTTRRCAGQSPVFAERAALAPAGYGCLELKIELVKENRRKRNAIRRFRV